MTRERAIPCRGATLAESRLGTHKTWADDGYCNRCRVLNAQSIARVRSSSPAVLDRSVSAGGSAGMLPTRAGSDLAVSSRTALHQTRGQVTSGDGFLSGPVVGEQVHSSGVRPSLPEPVPHAGPAHHLLAEPRVSPAPMSGARRLGHP